MSTSFYFYIVLAILASAFIASYQYIYKNRDKSKTKLILFLLRFFSVFLLLILIINPKIKKEKIETVRPKLIVLTDNSKSINKLKQTETINSIISNIKGNTEINKKYVVDFYSFSKAISLKDSLDFKGNTTNIYKAITSINKIYKNRNSPTILITDGNQTQGNSYANLVLKNAIYPIVVGDTTTFQDIYISQLNVNKYAYLKNKFPVELFVNYKGDKKITSHLTVKEGKSTVFSKNIVLNKDTNFEKVNFYINANSVGIHNYKVYLSGLDGEKNKLNNYKNFAVEVLNEQSKIAIISSILHPDIASLKRSIESNKQRKVKLLKPSNKLELTDYQLVILYQPNVNFKEIFTQLQKVNKNFLIITGKQTNWNFLNNAQNYFNKKAIQKTEDHLAKYNPAYTVFLSKDLGFENFQPVTDFFGKISFSVPYETLLFQQIGAINSQEPLLATFEQNNRRGAVLFGENSWRWRMSSKLEENSFQPYDEFVNKLVQYLASNKKASFLEISNKSYYYQNETVKIEANYYDANYTFDPNAKLWIQITNKQTKKSIKYPLALKDNHFEVNISDLNEGNYSFSIFDEDKKNKEYGNFSILDYNLEEQFVSANDKDLNQLALNSDGELFYVNNYKTLLANLIHSDKYKSIQKSKEITTPLIDWKWLLGLIVVFLSTEWFIRKYKGYI